MANNPFIPGDPINNPIDFIGRKEELLRSLDSITNNRNVIITGSRGIGKTSLADQLLNILKGNHQSVFHEAAFQKINLGNSQIASHYCVKSDTLKSVIEGLLESLKRGSFESKKLKLSGEFNLGVIKGKVESNQINREINSTTTFFVSETINYIKNTVNENTKICFYLDEIDVLTSSVDIGSFVKVSKELLRAEGYVKIVFLLVGQSGAVYSLIDNHASVGRTFTTIELPKMTDNEVLDIITNGEKKAKILFDDGVKRSIINLSKGFPSVVQLICYNCFFQDKDQFIDFYDFENALITTSKHLKTERYINDNIDLNKHQLALEILEYLCDSDMDFLEISQIIKHFSFNNLEEQIIMEIDLLKNKNYVKIINNEIVHLRDKLISVYFNIQNIKHRTTELIKNTIKILESKRFKTIYLTNEDLREVDLIASKKKKYIFWSTEIKYGISCVPDSEIISKEFIDFYLSKVKVVSKKYDLDEILIVSEKKLRTDIELKIISGIGIKFFTKDELYSMNIDNL